jgi:energy-coupling factor transporter ATP-binding protein EcfA2
MIGTAPGELRALVDRLERLAERRLALGQRSEPAAIRARQLVDHVRSHVRVRANSLDAPLVVLLVGPTGAGKSTIFNTIAGRAASPTGVLRPTTRTAVVLAHSTDRAGLREGALEGFSAASVRFVTDNDIAPGLALIDTPDVDSVEHANRLLADRLVEAADLAVFVTTATRYADRVPWSVLERIRERGLPLLVVVNRMPDEAQDRAEVMSDVERLMAEAGLETELIGVREGDLEPDGARLLPQPVRRLTDEIARLRADRDARLELATRALMGSLAGLGESVERVADDVDHEAIDIDALRRVADRAFESGLADLQQEVRHGSFLREEALRHWQAFVGADQMTRFFSDGIGRIRGAIQAALRPASAPVREVRAATTDDLLAAARLQAAEAARRTASTWADWPGMGETMSADADLWLPSPDFDERLRGRLEGWIDSIVADIQLRGSQKRSLARGGTLGVNVLGTGVMLASFLHTGGLTGAEIGVAAATAFLNQKLLAALFGEAAMAELVGDARQRLQELLQTTFDEERVRFDTLLPPEGVLPALANDLRVVATDLRALPVRE